MNQSKDYDYDENFDELEKTFPGIDAINLLMIELICNKQLTPEKLKRLKTVEQYVNQCFNDPSEYQLTMYALNELLDGFGVEYIRIPEREWDSYWYDIYAIYVNMGDTYNPTIIFDCRNKSFHLTSWGDFYETLEKTEDISY